MYGSDIGSLSVNVATSTQDTEVWRRQGQQGNVWIKGEVEIFKQTTEPFTVSNLNF